MTAVLAPIWAAFNAATYPPGPAPITAMSYWLSLMRDSFYVLFSFIMNRFAMLLPNRCLTFVRHDTFIVTLSSRSTEGSIRISPRSGSFLLKQRFRCFQQLLQAIEELSRQGTIDHAVIHTNGHGHQTCGLDGTANHLDVFANRTHSQDR